MIRGVFVAIADESYDCKGICLDLLRTRDLSSLYVRVGLLLLAACRALSAHPKGDGGRDGLECVGG